MVVMLTECVDPAVVVAEVCYAAKGGFIFLNSFVSHLILANMLLVLHLTSSPRRPSDPP